MKRLAAALLAAAAVPAAAQTSPPQSDSLQIYGSIDAGVTWIDDAAGHSRRYVSSGNKLANRLGFRGTEDMGGGLGAIFTLENGFNVDDGSVTLGGRFFGRQAYVGLTSRTWGALTVGRQYDFLYAGSPMPLDMGALLIGGLSGATGGAGTSVDNHLGGVRHDNTVKWTKLFNRDWTVGLMYGLGSENREDKMASAVLVYRASGVWLGAGYLRDNYSPAASGNRIGVLSANWDVSERTKLVANLSSSKAAFGTDRTSSNEMVQVGFLHRITQPLTLGAMLGHSDIRNAADAKGRIQQLGAGFAYNFSRRTELYGIASQVRSSGSAGTAYSGIPGIGGSAATLRSSSGHQLVLKAGIKLLF